MRPLPPAARQRLALGAAALVLASLAVVMAHRWAQAQRQTLAAERQRLMADYQKPVEVLVAARDLPENTVLDAADVQTARVPEKYLQPYATRALQDLAGRVTVAPIAAGEQVLLNKVRRPDAVPANATLAGLTPKGKRSVTIGVDAMTGVGGFVRPGDQVDLLWTVKLPGAGGPGEQVVTVTLFQDVPVMAVGRDLAGHKAADVGKGRAENEFTVTLALTPQETALLLFAREQGRVQLSLRPRSEEGTPVAVPPANINTLNAMMEAQLGKSEEPAAKAARQIEVYKGLKRDVVSVTPE